MHTENTQMKAAYSYLFMCFSANFSSSTVHGRGLAGLERTCTHTPTRTRSPSCGHTCGTVRGRTKRAGIIRAQLTPASSSLSSANPVSFAWERMRAGDGGGRGGVGVGGRKRILIPPPRSGFRQRLISPHFLPRTRSLPLELMFAKQSCYLI